MKALLLVDIQNDFLPGGALAVPEGDQIIPIANHVQSYFNLVIATQDWHPADHGSFAANHPNCNVGQIIDLEGLQQMLWPVHCVQNTSGAEFAPSLDRARWSSVVQKGSDSDVDSYSAFFDNGYRNSTGLTLVLREHRVAELYVLGLATDYCVKFSVLDAIAEGFTVYVITDACRGVNVQPNDAELSLEAMAEAGAKLISSDELPTLLRN